MVNVKRSIKKKSSATLEELQLLVGFLLFTAKLFISVCVFLRRFYDVLS